MQMMERTLMDLGRAKLKRDAVQQVVQCVVDRVGRFNRDRVDRFYLEAYDAKMTARDVDEAIRLEYFCQVVAVGMHGEVKEL
mgnify:FL=1